MAQLSLLGPDAEIESLAGLLDRSAQGEMTVPHAAIGMILRCRGDRPIAGRAA